LFAIAGWLCPDLIGDDPAVRGKVARMSAATCGARAERRTPDIAPLIRATLATLAYLVIAGLDPAIHDEFNVANTAQTRIEHTVIIMANVELVKAWLSFLSSLAWPAALLTIACIFRTQLRNLIQRLQSGEVAGAKFNFNEAASAFIQSKLDELADQNDPRRRARLAGEIKGVAAAISGIHPLSLGILINAAEGPHSWVSTAYTSKRVYFDELEQADLTHVRTQGDGDTLEASLETTPSGRNLLESIGMRLK